jgi:hypothetical protein
MKKISTPVLTRSLPTAICFIARFKSRRETAGGRRAMKDATDVETEVECDSSLAEFLTDETHTADITDSAGCLHVDIQHAWRNK